MLTLCCPVWGSLGTLCAICKMPSVTGGCNCTLHETTTISQLLVIVPASAHKRTLHACNTCSRVRWHKQAYKKLARELARRGRRMYARQSMVALRARKSMVAPRRRSMHAERSMVAPEGAHGRAWFFQGAAILGWQEHCGSKEPRSKHFSARRSLMELPENGPSVPELLGRALRAERSTASLGGSWLLRGPTLILGMSHCQRLWPAQRTWILF